VAVALVGVVERMRMRLAAGCGGTVVEGGCAKRSNEPCAVTKAAACARMLPEGDGGRHARAREEYGLCNSSQSLR
jgi:hypothetical protein